MTQAKKNTNLVAPDVAERCGHVGHEGNHREDEAHRDNGNDLAIVVCFSHIFRLFS